MPGITRTNFSPQILLEKALEERTKGAWIYLTEGGTDYGIVTNALGKLFCILTSLFQTRSNDEKLADLMTAYYVKNAITADQLGSDTLRKSEFVKRMAKTVSQAEKISKKVTNKVDRDKLDILAKKTIAVAIEVLQNTDIKDSSYLETLQAVETLLSSINAPLVSQNLLTEKQRTAFLNYIDKIKAHHFSILSLKDLITLPEANEVNKAKRLFKGTAIGEGISGSYTLYDRTGNACGIYKPDAETTGEVDNANGAESRMVHLTQIPPSKISIREEAAHVLDRGFSGVPRTRKVTLRGVQLEGKKHSYTTGSLQQWIQGATSFDKVSQDELLNVNKEDLHHLAIQDMRWLNADRHFGNILLGKDGKVTPIDHGFILPNKATRLVFNWLKLPQTKLPISSASKQYILSLNPEKDAAKLKKIGIEKAAIERMKISTYLLQEGIKNNLNLHEIAQLYINGPDPFTLTGLRSHNSYFESDVVKPILLHGEPAKSVVSKLVSDFVAQRDQYKNNPTPFRTIGWKAGNRIANGIHHFQFSHLLEGSPQSIHVIKIDSDQQDQYRLQVVDHREISKTQDNYDPKVEDQRMTLEAVSTNLPDALAIINGGFYHYSHEMYYWDLERFKISDPVGVLKVNGEYKLINHSTPARNPAANLWGAISVNETGNVHVGSDESTIEHSFEALGCGPMLIEKGKVQTIASKVTSIVKKRKIFSSKSYHAPGNFIEHYKERHPRTCFGQDADGSWYMVVVDGRSVGSSGMTLPELAQFIKGMGCTQAINLDGGGSSQMMARTSTNSMTHLNTAGEPNRPIATSLAVVRRETEEGENKGFFSLFG